MIQMLQNHLQIFRIAISFALLPPAFPCLKTGIILIRTSPAFRATWTSEPSFSTSPWILKLGRHPIRSVPADNGCGDVLDIVLDNGHRCLRRM